MDVRVARPRGNRAPALLLGTLVVMCVVGSVLGAQLVGSRLAAFRPFSVGLAMMLALVSTSPLRSLGRRTTLLLVILAGWLLYAVVTLVWAPSLPSAIVALFALASGVAIVYCLVTLAAHAGPTAALGGWFVGACLASAVALVELLMARHLPSAFAAARPGERFVASTFGNPNDFAAFLLVALPFTVALARSARAPLTRVVAWTAVPVFAGLVVASRSRLCSAGLVVVGAYYVFGQRPRTLAQVRRLRVIPAAVIVALAALIVSPSTTGRFRNIPAEIAEGGSTRDRYLLIREGMVLFGRSHFVGIGAGGFEATVKERETPLTGSGTTNPHNFPAEVLSQYGLLVPLALLAWFGLTWRSVGARLGRSHASGLGVREVAQLNGARCALVTLVMASMDPSSFIVSPTGWLAIGTVAALARGSVNESTAARGMEAVP